MLGRAALRAMMTNSSDRYFLGTGLISVVGISFAIIPVATGAFKQMYANGFCPTDADGTLLPCPGECSL